MVAPYYYDWNVFIIHGIESKFTSKEVLEATFSVTKNRVLWKVKYHQTYWQMIIVAKSMLIFKPRSHFLLKVILFIQPNCFIGQLDILFARINKRIGIFHGASR